MSRNETNAIKWLGHCDIMKYMNLSPFSVQLNTTLNKELQFQVFITSLIMKRTVITLIKVCSVRIVVPNIFRDFLKMSKKSLR